MRQAVQIVQDIVLSPYIQTKNVELTVPCGLLVDKGKEESHNPVVGIIVTPK